MSRSSLLESQCLYLRGSSMFVGVGAATSGPERRPLIMRASTAALFMFCPTRCFFVQGRCDHGPADVLTSVPRSSENHGGGKKKLAAALLLCLDPA